MLGPLLGPGIEEAYEAPAERVTRLTSAALVGVAAPAAQPKVGPNCHAAPRCGSNVLDEEWLWKEALRAKAVAAATGGVSPDFTAQAA